MEPIILLSLIGKVTSTVVETIKIFETLNSFTQRRSDDVKVKDVVRNPNGNPKGKILQAKDTSSGKDNERYVTQSTPKFLFLIEGQRGLDVQ